MIVCPGKSRLPAVQRRILQSGSTLRQTFATASMISSNRLSSASTESRCDKKLTLAAFTPSSLLMALSIFAAQFAQSRFSSL